MPFLENEQCETQDFFIVFLAHFCLFVCLFVCLFFFAALQPSFFTFFPGKLEKKKKNKRQNNGLGTKDYVAKIVHMLMQVGL